MSEMPAPLSNWLVKHPKWSLLIFILYTIFIGGSGWIIAFKTGPTSIKTEVSQQNTQVFNNKISTEDSIQIKETCYKEEFSKNEEKWEIKFYGKNKDGFWCPVKFVDPVMWYKDGVEANFQKISLEYKVKKNDNLKTDNPPSFIFAYGREGKNEVPILKLWVPENPNLQLFGFAKNLDFDSDKQLLTRENSESLPDPVKIERNDTLTITRTRAEGNELFLDFHYRYTSSVNLEDQNKTIQKVVKLPVSNIGFSAKKFPFGIGTYVGNCIGEIYYEICR